jgi:hypothetical protein
MPDLARKSSMFDAAFQHCQQKAMDWIVQEGEAIVEQASGTLGVEDLVDTSGRMVSAMTLRTFYLAPIFLDGRFLQDGCKQPPAVVVMLSLVWSCYLQCQWASGETELAQK